ncbi:hypothetical protein PP175_21430 [Aneurinibacillus sp. Ricciae_BoGa-3]|uniref:hypothetical protein n=1 Tax=Aneurinibacillus sp. Ricciae_BoGa-3 TaxID=3022697 RepID=UPI0023401E52|nr:hypothetical protein [Aneurinibacillus sp. Ricciae_BoGa-3]WCK53854.1 hypothetical protein PP175_21430 [Aneurinibacillus sp. Ricciae_BoGa-3]
MIGYAYMSKSGTLHIVDKRSDAEEFSVSGKIVETDLPHRGGYEIDAAGENLIAEDGVVHIDDAHAAPVSLDRFPELKALYEQVK